MVYIAYNAAILTFIFPFKYLGKNIQRHGNLIMYYMLANIYFYIFLRCAREGYFVYII
jgi:hypothetical protein